MVWLTIIIISTAFAAFLYSRRYISRTKFAGLYLIQFYYLFVISPLIFISITNIALEIIARPEIQNIPLPTVFIFSTFAFGLSIGIVGNGIHSTSTSVSQAFEDKESKAFATNELFHGPLGHDMIYLGGVLMCIFLAYLEINHPDVNRTFGLNTALLFGVIIGLGEVLSIIWSTHVGINLIGTFIGMLAILIPLSLVPNLEQFPIAVVLATSLFVVTLVLSLTALIFLWSKKLSKHLIRLLFPKGHPLHESLLFV